MSQQTTLFQKRRRRPNKALTEYSTPAFFLSVILFLGLLSNTSIAQLETVRPAGLETTGSVTADPREPCVHFTKSRRPFFGDLHVHTQYSLDANTQGTRTSPDDAYRFAQGQKVGIQPWAADGSAMRSLQLRQPLDFAMVSDHAELIGEVRMCNVPGVEGYDAWQCRFYRKWPRGAFYLFNAASGIGVTHLGLCGDDAQLCLDAARVPWQEMQDAAQDNYDRSSDCSFTTFVGYEWTGMAGLSGGNLHRNVVFRNADVPELPASFIDEPSAPQLWNSLSQHCNDKLSDKLSNGTDEGCDSLVIPHNSNISAGFMFPTQSEDGEPMTAEYASTRKRFEPLVEIMQHKGASECYFAAGVTEDELCAFEQMPIDNIAGLPRKPKADTGFVRQALTDGIALHQIIGANPYQFGFIGSTDTHLGTPGAADEDLFLGHGGAGIPARDEIPVGFPDELKYNPGGLAVLWAEENTRDSLFDAMLRREAYATSGPRIVTRFFAGWDLPPDLCTAPDRVALAYASGVPMGAELPPIQTRLDKPKFLLAASADMGSESHPGMPLQRIQIIKGWVEPGGKKHERVVDVVGDANNGAGVNLETCATHGVGAAQLCTVWTDDKFDPQQHAYYYSRVVENPSCRWSQRQCVAAGVNCNEPGSIPEGFDACCTAQHRPVVQERAWTSPIWYSPG